MPELPEVRAYVWQVTKTESRLTAGDPALSVTGQVASSRERQPETSFDGFEIPINGIMASLELTDGISEQDDTFRLTLTEDGWDVFRKVHTGPGYKLMGFTVNDRFFGPYDLEGHGYTKESKVLSFSGRIDREFEDTVIHRFHDVFFSPTGGGPNTRLQTVLKATVPFNVWNSISGFFTDMVVAQVGTSKDLSGIRSALNPLCLGVSPRTVPYITTGATFFVRDIELYSKYPTIINGVSPERQEVEYLEAGFAGRRLTNVAPKRIAKLQRIQDEDIWVSDAPALDVPDQNNEPGAYRHRRIDIAIKNTQASVEIRSTGFELPRMLLDPQAQGAYADVAMDMARWRLQNEAAKGTLTVHGDIRYIAGQYIYVNPIHLQYPYWRIDSTIHSLHPTRGYSCKLGLVLIQGSYSLPTNLERFTYPIPTAMPMPAEAPEVDSDGFWDNFRQELQSALAGGVLTSNDEGRLTP